MALRYEFGQLDYSQWQKLQRLLRTAWRRMYGDRDDLPRTARRGNSAAVGVAVAAAVFALLLAAVIVASVLYVRSASPTSISDTLPQSQTSARPVSSIVPIYTHAPHTVLHGLLADRAKAGSALPAHARSQQQRVLLVSYEIDGPSHSGGVGTATTHMARLLARQHRVTLLHAAGEQTSADSPLSFQGWQAHFRQWYDVELLALAQASSYRYASAIYEQVRSYEVLLWLMEHGRRFDVVHFHDWRGLGYYTLLSAQQGHPALQHLSFVTVCHTTTLWAAINRNTLPHSLAGLKVDFMERESLRFSQHVVSPSDYFLQWMVQHQYSFPPSSRGGGEARASGVYVMRNPIVVSPTDSGVTALAKAKDKQQPLVVVSEIVIVGRLGQLKALDIVLDAMDALQQLQPPPTPPARFTLLCVDGQQASSPQLRRRVQQLSARPEWSVLTNITASAAIAYLLQPRAGRLAVLPSRHDSSPYEVQEALVYGIPLLAADVGGAAELIDERDRAQAMFRPTVAALLARLVEVLADGLHPARPSFDLTADGLEWLDWHAQLQAPTAAATPPSPLVSVVMATYNRTRFVLKALQSLREQSYRNLEVVVVDDGTSHPACVAYLAEVAEFVRSVDSWQLLVVQHGGESVARNRGVAVSKGEYLIFMDDDNIARPEQVATFVRAAQHTRADILTCMADSFIEHADEAGGGGSGGGGVAEDGYRWMPLGPAAGVSAFNNVIGDANFIIRREVYEALGGFADGTVAEDWELLTRALLAGAHIQLIPHSLLWKRVSAASKRHITQAVTNQVAVADAYIGPHVPHELGLALLMSRQALAQRAADDLQLTNSVAHFGSKQGYRRWQYHSRVGDDGPLRPMEVRRVAVKGGAPSAEWRLLSADTDSESWSEEGMEVDSTVTSCIIRNKLQQPCCLPDGQPVSVLRTWLVDLDASVVVTGRVLRPQRCPAGGPLAFVQLNQRAVWEEADDEGVAHDTSEPLSLELAVELGDAVHFGVRPGERTAPACREMALEVNIALVRR